VIKEVVAREECDLKIRFKNQATFKYI
jgi:hypothetical protein